MTATDPSPLDGSGLGRVVQVKGATDALCLLAYEASDDGVRREAFGRRAVWGESRWPPEVGDEIHVETLTKIHLVRRPTKEGSES